MKQEVSHKSKIWTSIGPP